MPRKTTGKRLKLLYFKYGSILEPACFNETTKLLGNQLDKNLFKYQFSKTKKERNMYLKLNNTTNRNYAQNSSFAFLFNEGTDNIKNFLLNAKNEYLKENNHEQPIQLSDDSINQTVIDICYVFSTQQPWYLSYLYKKPASIQLKEEDQEFFNHLNQTLTKPITSTQGYLNISSEAHKKFVQTYYTPAVLIKKNIETAFTPSELNEFRKDNTKLIPLISKIDENLLKELRTVLGCTQNQVPEFFAINVKNIGLKLAIKNLEYTVPISSLTTLGMSTIFKSLPLNKKIVKFLHDNDASLSVIDLYEQLQKNPTLFFDLKQLALIDKKTLLQLESFISVFNEAFILPPTSIKLSPQEYNLIKKQHAFLYVDTTNPAIQKTRVDIHNTLSKLSSYVFPADVLPTNLTFLQLQNILLKTFLIIKKYNNILNVENKSNIIFKFLNTFTQYDLLHKRFKTEYKNSITFQKSIHNILWLAYFLSIMTGEKIEINKSLLKLLHKQNSR